MKLTGSMCKRPHCGESFTRLRAFDRHRVGSFMDRGVHRRCLTPTEMVERGWEQNSKGFWVIETQAKRRAKDAARRIHNRFLN